jgi:hypothetical protein
MIRTHSFCVIILLLYDLTIFSRMFEEVLHIWICMAPCIILETVLRITH